MYRMPFRQPESTIIEAGSVRSGGFSFRVEASLASDQTGGKLAIDASAGYLLTSSDGKAPRQHLTLDYVLQPDGSRVAHDTLMLLRGSEPATNGSVTLRDPAGETLLMRIISGEVALRPRQEPILTVDQPGVHFNKTEVGEEAYSILHINQQFSHTPVSVVVDDPTHFSIATGVKQLLFGPSLLFTPAPTGTYIHVRYQPGRPGRHAANLYIETPYQFRQVRLTGRTTGFIAPTLNRQPTTERVPAQRLLPAPAQSEPVRARGRLRLPVLLLLGALAYAGYTYRCELAPSLCRQSIIDETPPLPVVDPAAERPAEQTVTTKSETPVTNQSTKADTRRVVPKPFADEPSPGGTDEEPASRQTPADEADEEIVETEPAILARSRPRPELEPVKADTRRRAGNPTELPAALDRPTRRRPAASAQSSEESDLEQELNKKPGGNR